MGLGLRGGGGAPIGPIPVHLSRQKGFRAEDPEKDKAAEATERWFASTGDPGQIGSGVDRAAGDPNFEMHMRPMGVASMADLADRIAGRDRAPWDDARGEGLHMGIAGGHAVGVLIAVRVDHGAAGATVDGGTSVSVWRCRVHFAR